jgi:hypothetical protein
MVPGFAGDLFIRGYTIIIEIDTVIAQNNTFIKKMR